jgi:hypothetical protein
MVVPAPDFIAGQPGIVPFDVRLGTILEGGLAAAFKICKARWKGLEPLPALVIRQGRPALLRRELNGKLVTELDAGLARREVEMMERIEETIVGRPLLFSRVAAAVRQAGVASGDPPPRTWRSAHLVAIAPSSP